VIGNPCFHLGSDTKSFVDAAPVAACNPESIGSPQVRTALAKRIGLSRRSQDPILVEGFRALDLAGAESIPFRKPHDCLEQPTRLLTGCVPVPSSGLEKGLISLRNSGFSYVFPTWRYGPRRFSNPASSCTGFAGGPGAEERSDSSAVLASSQKSSLEPRSLFQRCSPHFISAKHRRSPPARRPESPRMSPFQSRR
jgi:hypothetical protein